MGRSRRHLALSRLNAAREQESGGRLGEVGSPTALVNPPQEVKPEPEHHDAAQRRDHERGDDDDVRHGRLLEKAAAVRNRHRKDRARNFGSGKLAYDPAHIHRN
ncbi:hypothetical protein ABZU32_36140 [Sphaerisporangium sp. NPDC005288]|uniref:hypothetical protein n=1 Tax=Sphaerisporangium sp. NPDC005288 TaxID=3155114 RepID=UPI0033AD29AC